jgi:hypothetical protein
LDFITLAMGIKIHRNTLWNSNGIDVGQNTELKTYVYLSKVEGMLIMFWWNAHTPGRHGGRK